MRLAGLVVVAGLLGSCRSAPVAGVTPPAVTMSPPSTPAPDAEPVPPPALVEAPADADAGPGLVGSPSETWRDGEIVVSLPIGARERRPIVVGIHGSHDRPETSCARWRRTLGGFAFVVCPRGVPYRGGLAWGSPSGVAERIDSAVAALRERYPTYVADGPVVYAGWSLGGTLGPKVVAARPGVFDPVVLVELGHTRLDAKASAAALRSSHVLIACATKRCAAFERRLEKASVKGANIGFVDAGIGRGHVFDDRMARTIGAAFAKVVANDPRWAGLSIALEASADAGTIAEPLPDEDAEPELVDDVGTRAKVR